MLPYNDVLKKYLGENRNTGSSEFQIVLSSLKINRLKEHLKSNKKDHSALRGLLSEVAKRKSHLKYIKKHNADSYNDLSKKIKDNNF